MLIYFALIVVAFASLEDIHSMKNSNKFVF